MWFKLVNSLGDMNVDRADKLPITVELDASTTLKFWMREESEQNRRVRTLCCDLVVERSTPDRVQLSLENLRNGQLLFDRPLQAELPYQSFSDVIVDKTGKITPEWALPLWLMPRAHQNYQKILENDLSRLIRDFVKNWRWRQNAAGSHSPFAHVSFEWSEDRKNWQPMPFDYGVGSLSVFNNLGNQEELLKSIAKSVMEGVSEPFPHELRREAQGLAWDRPRSSLLVAVTALETAAKQYIVQLAPDAEHVLEKMQSPPVLTMIQEIIPAIHKDKSINTKIFPLEKTNSDYLRKWITQRNQVAHGVKQSVDADELLTFVHFATDLLYAFDYLRGHLWAKDKIVTGRLNSL